MYLLTAVWGVVQIAVALIAIKFSDKVVNEVLGIASFTNGVILGLFFLGTFTKRVGQTAAFVGILLGVSVMLVPLLLLRWSQAQYISRTALLVSELRKTNAELVARVVDIARTMSGPDERGGVPPGSPLRNS